MATYAQIPLTLDSSAGWVTKGTARFEVTLEGQGNECAPPPEATTCPCNELAPGVGSGDNSEGDPVSTRSGAFHESFTDVSVATRGLPLEVRRGYSSLQAAREGPLGFGWSSNLDTRLRLDEPSDGQVTVVMPSGSETVFYETTVGGDYTAPSWVTADLSRSGSGSSATYELAVDDGRVLEFDGDGALTSITDRNGYVQEYVYAAGKLDLVRDVDSGRELDVDWQGSRVSSVTDPEGRSVSYVYGDGNGNLTDVTDISGGEWHFAYDGGHRLTHMRDAYQSTQAVPAETVNEYDSAGRVSEQTDPGGGVTVFDYSSIPGATKVTLPGNNTGARVVVDYYEAGRRIRSTDGYGTADAMTYRYAYDPSTGGVTEVVLESVSPERVVFEADYDRVGNVVWVEDALDRRTTYSDYDEFGQPGQVTSPDDAVTVLDYDVSGNLESAVTTGADSTSTSVSFDLDAAHLGEVDSMIDARGKLWDFGYDDNGYLVSVLDPEGHVSSSDVDEVGRIVWSRSPKGNMSGADPEAYTTHFVTNARGQVTSMIDPLDKSSSAEFDELGRPETVTNADNKVTRYHYTALGQPDVVTRPDLSTVQTQYWPDGSLKAQIDAAGAATQYGYDAVGRSATVTDPLLRVTSFEYRADGSLWWRQDPGGSCPSGPGCVVYTSDVAGQMKTATYADPATPDVVDVTYDAAGRRTSITTTAGTTVTGFDGLGRMTSSTEAGQTTGYQWDPAGNLTHITYPGNKTVIRGYDDAGRWTSVTDWDDRVFTFDPDPNGNVEKIHFPGGAQVDEFGFNRADRLEAVDMVNGATTVAALDYTRTDAGLLKTMTQSGLPGRASDTYLYDDLSRVTGADGTGYGYDTAGNLSDRGFYVAQRFDAANQVCYTKWGAASTCGSPPTGAVPFGYDSRGNRTSITPPDNSGAPSEFTYDGENRLTSATVPTLAGNQGEFTAVTPTRVSDTHPGSGMCPNACVALAAGQTVTVPVAGLAGVPAGMQLSAVSLQVTAESTGGDGGILVYNADRPNAGQGVGAGVSATYNDAQTSTTAVVSKVSAAGAVKVTNLGAGTAHIAVDVDGWYASLWGTSGGSFEPLDPARIYDSGPAAVPAGGSVDVAVLGHGGVPATGVGSVAATVTVSGATVDGRVVVYSTDVTAPPSGTTLTAVDGEDRSVLAQVAVGADGAIRVHNATSAPFTVAVDVAGWYSTSSPTNPAGDGFVAVDPTPVLTPTVVNAGSPVTIDITPALADPAEVTAVAVSVTAGIAGTDGTVSVWAPSETEPADAVVVSYSTGQYATNSAVVTHDGSGTITASVSAGSAVLLVDVVGYWTNLRRTTTYTYNADGIRQTRTNSTGTTAFRWDHASGLPMLLDETNGTATTRYLYGPGGMPLAQYNPDGTVWYLHHDQLGSTRAVTDTTGAVIATYTYDAWGARVAVTGNPAATNLGYAGQYTDPETGFQYLRARHYDPGTGQFLTRDPITAATRDRYGYAGGDPLNATDPSGLCDLVSFVTSFVDVIGDRCAAQDGNAFHNSIAAGVASLMSTQVSKRLVMGPDYYVVSGGVTFPWLQTLSGQLVITRYGDVYLGGVFGTGVGTPGPNASARGGYLNQPSIADKCELDGFLAGHANYAEVDAGPAAGPSLAEVWNTNGSATEGGVGIVPGAGAGMSYLDKVFDN